MSKLSFEDVSLVFIKKDRLGFTVEWNQIVSENKSASILKFTSLGRPSLTIPHDWLLLVIQVSAQKLPSRGGLPWPQDLVYCFLSQSLANDLVLLHGMFANRNYLFKHSYFSPLTELELQEGRELICLIYMFTSVFPVVTQVLGTQKDFINIY